MADNSPSLTEVVQQVAQQQQTQVSEIEKSRKLLIHFQTDLYELETELKSVLLETKSVEKNIQQADDTTENIRHLCEIQERQNHSIYAESIRLKLDLENQNEDFEAIVSRNNGYRERIADNIRHFSESENKLPVMIELIKKRDEVGILRRQKEEMMRDLHNPESSAIKQVQEGIAYLCENIRKMKESIASKNKAYNEKKQIHDVLQKEIEVQKKRFSAILKRLYCQLNKAQLNKRQYQWNIEQMKKTAADLRQSLDITL
ncbi:coiled-coil domain-containing protein 122 [Discoglossus pictus]